MKTQAIIPMVEAQARRHICKIAKEIGWDGGVVYVNYFAMPCPPSLAEVLKAAHQFRDSHHPIDDHSSPALKVLGDLLTHVFPQPHWEGHPQREITGDFFNAFVAGQELYADYICEMHCYTRDLIKCGIPAYLAALAASIRLAGAPSNDDERWIVHRVAMLLKGGQ